MKTWIATTALLACASVASAADLNKEVDELEVALQARIDAGAGGKELRLFNKVVRKLDKKPTVEVNDMKKVLGSVGKSGTADAAVLKEAADVLQCLCEIVQAQEVAVLAISVTIPNSSFQDKVVAKVDKAKVKFDFAKTFIETNPTKATKLLVGAYAKYLKAGKTANKLLVKAQPKPPPAGFSFIDIFIENTTSKPHNLKEIDMQIVFLDEDGAQIGTSDGKATDVLPSAFTAFENRIFPGGLYDWGRFVSALFQESNPPAAATHFRGTLIFRIGKFAPFGYEFITTPVRNFYFPN